MNVLSLFDGMSCGQIALQRAGIHVDNYYASEIDKSSIGVTMHHWPKTIKLGSVVNVDTNNLPIIHLLIGGSPCQGFSMAGKMLNFDDHRSKLFFEWLRIKNELKPKYFLLENVKMKQHIQDEISRLIGVQPIFICSSNFSAQKRKRLYWTNIPIKEMKATLSGSVLQDIICNTEYDVYLNEKEIQNAIYKHSAHAHISTGTKMGKVKFPTPINEKSKCLNTLRIKSSRDVNHIEDSKGIRLLNVTEYEKLQTVPVGYTLPATSLSSRYKMLGNGWTVDVIANILSYIKQSPA